MDILRKNKINPLIIDSQSWETDAETLRNTVNFLIQLELSGRDAPCYIDE